MAMTTEPNAKSSTWRLWLIIIGILFTFVGCEALKWNGCLKAEGSFFYCMAVLSN